MHYLPQKRSAFFLLALLLTIATSALYYPVRNYSFLNYDDEIYVTENLHVKYGLNWEVVKWAFTTNYASNWHPLTWISHALDCQLFYTNPARHHETNLLLHVLNVVILFWVLHKATGNTGRSFMVAALFALHPVNVESVAWIAERKNLLSMFFFLLALGAYAWYARKPQVDRYLVVALLFALGLMAKPQVITFPCVLLLWDYWPLQRMGIQDDGTLSADDTTGFKPARTMWWLIGEKIPLFALSAASAILTMRAQSADYAISNALNAFPFVIRLKNAVWSEAQYIRMAVWPTHFSVLYPHPGNSLGTLRLLLAALLLIAATALVVRSGSHHRYLPVGWFWFLGTSVPMIGLIQVGSQGMADRYAYLPFIGLFIMICWGVSEWAEGRHIPVSWLFAASIAVLLSLAVMTHRQITYWKDDVTLWSHAVQVTNNNWEAENNLAATYLSAAQADKALPHLETAELMAPSNPWTRLYLGWYEQEKENLPEANVRYQELLSLTQDDAAQCAGLRIRALASMASNYRTLGDFAKASEFADSAKRESEAAEAHAKANQFR
jgi:tetratricopeptide (TPR) repeat protein